MKRLTCERRQFLRRLGENNARCIPENQGILPENILSYLRTSLSAHAW